jgi:hypothetical protein
LDKKNDYIYIVEDANNGTLYGNYYTNFFRIIFPPGYEVYCYHYALHDFKITLSDYSLADYHYFSIAVGEMTDNSTSGSCYMDDSASLSAFSYDYGYTTTTDGDSSGACGYFYGIDFFSSSSTSTIYGALDIYTNSCRDNVII